MIETSVAKLSVPVMLACTYQSNAKWMILEAQSWCRDQAEDLVHETFLTLLRRGQEGFLVSMEAPDQARYLRRCLLNHIHKDWTRSNRLRRGGRVEMVSLEAAAERGECIEVVDKCYSLEADELQTSLQDIEAALSLLKQRMTLSAWERVKPFLEIDGELAGEADAMCRQNGALRTALSRARGKLRHILKTIKTQHQVLLPVPYPEKAQFLAKPPRMSCAPASF